MSPAIRNCGKLNRTYLGKDYATDVLSFPGAAPYLGDIAISLGRARAQARQFGHSAEDEVRILMLHGRAAFEGHGPRVGRRPDGSRGEALARGASDCPPA